MRIQIRNLAFSTTEDDLREVFETYGRVDAVSIPGPREHGHHGGVAVVDMPERDEAIAAITGVHGSTVGGRPLIVDEAAG